MTNERRSFIVVDLPLPQGTVKWLIFLLLVIFTTKNSFSQWTWRNPLPQGNDLNVIRFAGDQSVWAGGYVGTLMHSVDGGQNWNINNIIGHDKFVNFIGIDFPDNSTGYAVDEWGLVYRTVDGGITWDSVYYEYDEYLTASCFTSPLTGHIACSHGKILRTTDGGTTWISQIVSQEAWFRGLSFPTQQTGYACGSCISKTTDGGVTWNVVVNDTTKWFSGIDFSSPDEGIAIGNNGLVMKTANGGVTWSSQYLGDSLWLTSIGLFGPDTVLLNGYAIGYIPAYIYPMKFRSTDGGATWARLILPDDTLITRALACRPGGTAYASGGYGILEKTEDYGNTWTLITNLINQPLSWGYSISGIDFPSQQNGYAVSGGYESQTGTVMKTTDGGDNWVKLEPNWTSVARPCLDFLSDDIGCICSNNIYSTFDGGASWMLRYTGSWDVSVRSVSFGNGTTGVAVGDKGLFLRSTDMGQSWGQVAGLPDLNYKAVHFADANTAYAAGPSAILKSADAGATWTTVSTAYSLQALWFTSPAIGFGVGPDGLILRTTNGGASWNVMNSTSTENLNAIHFYDADTGYVAGGTEVINGVVLKTTDGGTTWHKQFVPVLSPLYCIRTTGNHAFTGGWGCFLFGTNNGGVGVSAGPETKRPFLNTTAYPNPSAGPVMIRYTLSLDSEVQISFFDAFGAQVKEPLDLRQEPGTYTLRFPSKGLKPGLYFYTLRVNDHTETGKIILMK